MPNYLEIGNGLLQHLPLEEGCRFSLKLNKKGIEALSKSKPELQKTLSELTENVDNPTLEIAQKMKNNYGIVSFRLSNGNELVRKGSYSNGAVEKVHIEENGIATFKSKENGITKTVEQKINTGEEQAIKPAVVEPEKVVKSHQENLEDFIKEMSDEKNYFGMRINGYGDKTILKRMTPSEFNEFKELIQEAKKLELQMDNAIEFRGDKYRMAVDTPDGKRFLFMDIYRPDSPCRIPVLCNNNEMIYVPVDESINLGALYRDFNSSNRMDRLRSHINIAKLVKENWKPEYTAKARNATEQRARSMNEQKAKRELEDRAFRAALIKRGTSPEEMSQLFHPSCQGECDAAEAARAYYKNQHWI